MINKPFAESCEQNKLPILEVLKIEFADKKNILEIGSGTGQHAVFFAEQFPHLTWQTSECQENIPGIQAWINDCAVNNVINPIVLDVNKNQWPNKKYDGIFSANTVHIMSWPEVEKMFAGIGQLLENDGCFCLYGPFNYNHQFTSDSNARFDIWLKEQAPYRGIRDFGDLDDLANNAGLTLKQDYEMPSNNRTLVWTK